jgi:hypothetical protein
VSARAAVALITAALAVGCGGNGSHDAGASHPPRSAATVIRAWADTLRRGDVDGAAAYFALPAIVQNGTPPLRLETRAQARAFNASLPCGARLIRTTSAGRFTTAVFRLTERPGRGRCGSGAGQTARTTFVISGGKIREWRRVANEPQPAGPLV